MCGKPGWERRWGLAIVLALALNCTGRNAESEELLSTFYDNLSRGNYAEAMALYSSSAAESLEGASDAFADWAKEETRSGTVTGVRVLQATEAATDSTVVEYEVRFADGSKKRGRVTLMREDGSLKMGLVG